jgi:hypothetical protein
MNTHRIGTGARRWWAASALLLASCVATLPAIAANCNPNGYQVNPNNQNFQEYDASNGYAHTLVTLGVNKVAADGVVLSWVQTGGPAVTLNTSNPAAPTFLAPDVATSTILTFRLTATCPDGGNRTDTGTFTILNTNRPPVAYASATPPIAYEGASILLRGTAPAGTPVSSDPDGDALFYAWTQTAGPAVTLANAGTATASFTAPATGSAYTLQFQLRVSDRATGGLSSTAPVVVNISPNSLPPIAALACPEQIGEHDHVLLDGSASSAGNGGTLSYAWSQIQGSPAIVIGNETGNTVEFDAPALTTGFDGLLEFHLLVSETSGSSTLSDLAQCLVQIVDVTPPLVSVPSDIVIEASSPNPVPVTFNAFAQDAAEDALPYPLPVAACTPPSGSLFALAAAPTKAHATAVTCSATDLADNAGSASFDVVVQDTTAPVMTVPGSLGVEATGSSGAIVSFSVPTEDAVDGAGEAQCAPASGSTFALGTTPVTCNAQDLRLNAAASASFPVTVHDTTPPQWSDISDDLVAEATSAAGAVVAYTAPTATDLVDGPVTVTCLPLSGANFPLGDTVVTCDASDTHGNSTADPAAITSATFKVTVRDTTAPTLSLPANLTEEATSADGAVVAFTATAQDLVDGAVVVTCLPASGSTFALATTTVSCSAADVRGNTATGTFTIAVQDTTPPTIDVHLDIGPLEATGPDGATATYESPSTHDLVDGLGTATCLPATGSTFAIGTSAVTCDATDHAGNHAIQTTFDVVVQDTTKPIVTAPANVGPVEATGPLTTVAHGSATDSDVVGVVFRSNDAPAQFPVGTTMITWIARDLAGNEGSATSTVTVVDTTAPILGGVGPDITVEATSPAGAAASWPVPTAFDLVDGARPVSCTPAAGGTFALGTTTVTCSASDTRGNEASRGFTVTVRDTTAPVIAAHADVNVIASSNSSAVVTYTTPTATDLVDTSVTVTCTPVSGSTFNAGSTTVTCSATDHAGNTATSSFKVNVSYSFNGFFQPVDNAAVNTVKAGSAIPVKFSLGGNQGLAIFAVNSPASIATAQCDGSTTDEVEVTVTAGNSSLSYDAGANQYNYVWKTEKNWIGCRQLRMTLKDGSVRTAMFKFR